MEQFSSLGTPQSPSLATLAPRFAPFSTLSLSSSQSDSPHTLPRVVVSKKQPIANQLIFGSCSGTGYIGSFTSLALLQHGYDVVIVDSLYNSSEVALDRIELLAGRRPAFYKLDVTDEKALDDVFQKHPAIDSVIHFAALKASCLLSSGDPR